MQAPDVSRPLEARRSGPLKGRVAIPGDKSISHRALILGALAVGETRISRLLEGDDVLATAEAMRRLGARVVRDEEGEWRVHGVGVGGWSEPDGMLDFGNSGTGARLAMGAMATTGIVAGFTGDASLRRRPMRRVLEPLTRFGATYVARDGVLMPLMITGTAQPICIDHEVEVASAQVKSALLLAALNAPGRSRISQAVPTRDHTERMLKAFGAEITTEQHADGGEAIEITGEAELHPVPVTVPADPSSAVFPLGAALLVQGSEIVLPGVLLNPRRTGLLETLREMGAAITVENRRESGGEEIGDLVARASLLQGVEVPSQRAPAMIDEYPILAVLAAFAEGRTVMRGLSELRVKESDRLSGIAQGLAAIGVNVQEIEDGLIVEGRGPDGVRGGARVLTHMDHRLAMAFLVAGLASREPVSVDDATMVRTSFPDFRKTMRALGAVVSVVPVR
ncbi:MAG TPA: 3-phosphoshikimate 1-carboxyvinyltransferase [Rhizomicrobium sp.]|jgi:3-phosphoshikimate 1-carboxyvinyltransferase|nr:3-phosphoshikimate 1-carboxyvinyltransferase [Rhizomicrobium sp.]